jgi:hypothetical protein
MHPKQRPDRKGALYGPGAFITLDDPQSHADSRATFASGRCSHAYSDCMSQSRIIGVCCIAIIAALYVVGFVSGTVLRHAVQTAPIWIGVVLGLRSSPLARWIALPFFLFWFAVVVLIWLFLFNLAHVVSGTFTPPEVAMTVVMGCASIGGIAAAMRRSKRASTSAATLAFLTGAMLQFAAFRISVLPGIATR